MGDVGDYWNEHKEYRRKQKARRLGNDLHNSPDKPLGCSFCRQRFWKEASLAQHLKDKHNITSEEGVRR
jgi:hypothetical protein